MIADDTRKPMDPSGIRFGTPAITTRGFREAECAQVAEYMIEAMKHRDDAATLDRIREDIRTLCTQFPIPESFA
jgi:glycine hydroxymethyltransferase